MRGKSKVGKAEEERLKKKSRKLSITEGSFHSVMEGFGSRYITPYALAFGAGNTFIGILSTLPGLLGNLSQVFSVRFTEKFPRKRIAFYGAAIQAIFWLPLIVTGIFFFLEKISLTASLTSLIIFYTLLVISGSFIGPAWSSWMRDLMIKGKIGEYYGKRNRIAGTVSLLSMLAAGLILDFYTGKNIFLGFAIIFSVAFIGRCLSAYTFTKKYEPKIKFNDGYYFSFPQFIKKMPYNNFGRFVLYGGLMSLSVAIASPFFAVYMLSNLNFTYLQFTIVTISSAIAMLIFMPIWGKFSDKYGDMTTLKITGYLIALVPLLWLLSPLIGIYLLIPYLVLVEAFSGIVWGGFNLSSGTFISAAVTRERMPLCVAYHSFILAGGSFIGAILGGRLASLDLPIFGLAPILFIFLLSFIARFGVSSAMLPHLKEVEPVEKLNLKLVKRVSSIPKNIWHIAGIKRPGFNS